MICATAGADPIAVANHSFENPVIDPGGFPVVTFADSWTELDNDTEGSQNTGVFLNTPPERAMPFYRNCPEPTRLTAATK
jgi:hypothetical protein